VTGEPSVNDDIQCRPPGHHHNNRMDAPSWAVLGDLGDPGRCFLCVVFGYDGGVDGQDGTQC